MLQHDKPDDFVCSMGESHSIEELCIKVFTKLEREWSEFVTIDPKYFRPTELEDLKGDCTKLKTTLGWKPEYTFDSMIDEMVEVSKKENGVY